MLPLLFTSGALSDPVLFESVVQHWLSAIDRDRIAVGLSFESPPVCITWKGTETKNGIHSNHIPFAFSVI